MRAILNSINLTKYSMEAMRSVLYQVHVYYSVQCTLYTVHCTLYTVQCTLYTILYTSRVSSIRSRQEYINEYNLHKYDNDYNRIIKL